MRKRYRNRTPEPVNNSFYEINLSEIRDLFLKNYLYKLYSGEAASEKIQVSKITGLNSVDNIIPRSPSVNYNAFTGLYTFTDSLLLASVVYAGGSYEICFLSGRDSIPDIYFYNVKIAGISNEAKDPAALLRILDVESIRCSSLNNKLLSYKLVLSDFQNIPFVDSINIIEPKNILPGEIYLPQNKKEQIERFIYAMKNFKNDGINLRYLLSGHPGTGKTQIMNSIASAVQGQATVIFTEGSSVEAVNLFELSSLFEQTLLIIDDVDFLITSRNETHNRKSLGIFLQFLDGFIPNNVFLLASTNDKQLVDYAASRPGRFDLILDISEINSDNYLDLLKRETDDEKILRLFDSSTLELLKRKRVTGAFIVSLVKQLESLKRMNKDITRGDFDDMINLTHRGFYSSNLENINSAVGF